MTGPRQCGKTTLARVITDNEPDFSFLNLEKAVDRHRLETPEQTLSVLTGLVVIDEIQRQPQPFETLRVLLDRPVSTTRFLLLGSASPTLIKGPSETLAGRMGLVDLAGFDLKITDDSWRTLWQRMVSRAAISRPMSSLLRCGEKISFAHFWKVLSLSKALPFRLNYCDDSGP